MHDSSLANIFQRHFHIRYANNQHLKNQVYKIRHKVYCEELGWEQENKQLIEKDKYDDFSHHFLIFHKASNQAIGCVRLVSPQFLALEQTLPCELFYPQEDMAKAINQSHYFSSNYGEVSRLAILSSFRRRKRDICPQNSSSQIFRIYEKEDLRTFPLISVGLYLSVIACADILKNKGLFIVAATALSKKLSRLGAPIKPILNTIEHRGERRLNFILAENVQKSLVGGSADLYSKIKHDISMQMSDVKRELLEIA